ncbi:hypothetical protein RJ640_015397, partial [Escallonia rubra]
MKPWEALDLDDSDDVASPLRPCKRRHQNQPSESNQTTPSSHQPSSQTQTLNSCLIPGPAGIIQSAMLRKARDTNRSFSSGEAPVATQEYIRRAVEDAEQDDDFKRNPWLSALGMVDVLPSTPLSSIKKFLHFGKVDLVVAVIKSCTPNGLGDLMVTLKDPTGTVRGTINHKVLTEDEFVKEISVGSVLILQKVAFFAPSRSSHYLNITLRNVVKVISKDVGPPLRMNYPASTVNYAAPEHGEKATVVQNAPSLEQGRTEGMVEEISETANGRGRLPIDSQKGNRNAFSGSDHYSNKRRSINQIAALGREPLVTQVKQGTNTNMHGALATDAVTLQWMESDEGSLVFSSA